MMRSHSQAYQQISGVIERFELDQSLLVEENFVERIQALDTLEFHLPEEIDQMNEGQFSDNEKTNLMERSQALKHKLDMVNEQLFARLLERMQANDSYSVDQFLRHMASQIARNNADEFGYDELDMLINGLLDVALIPEETRERDADMMFYQPTPVRIVLKLIDQLHLTRDDVFYDLGAGLGHVSILISTLTGATSKGVERDDSYINYSLERLKKLNLSRVEFIHADVRNVDYSDGTVFYLYTPFQGQILQDVMRQLEGVSRLRTIRVCAYGPCNLQVGKQNWLQSIFRSGKREDSFGIFVSR